MDPLENLRDFCRLRIAVAFLGEAPQHSWWKTSFLTATGWRFIERLFPRTSRVAAAESAFEAAKRVHDAAIGKGGVAHLFRLGPEQEEKLHDVLVSFTEAEIESLCVSGEETRAILTARYHGKSSASVGPMQVGSLAEALGTDAASVLAPHYLEGFAVGSPTFPYFA